MALTYCVLASGSAGNCLWVRGGGVEVLLDCGLPLRTVSARMEDVGLDVRAVSAVLCTHGHGDHVSGVPVLWRKLGVRPVGTPPTLMALAEVEGQAIGSRARFSIGGLTVSCVPTPHDAAGSVSFVVSDGDTSIGLLTDVGTHTRTLIDHLSGLDALVLETNHDPDMLENRPYPEHLKRRIRGGLGHLSNGQSARLLERVLHPGLQHLTLAHLSETNNEPARAVDAIAKVIDGTSVKMAVASQDVPGRPIQLSPRRGAQLGFAFG